MNDSRNAEAEPELGGAIRSGEIVIPCADLAASLNLFTGTLAFKLDLIYPADAPTVAVVSGHGLTLRLESGTVDASKPPVRLRLHCDIGSLPQRAPREFLLPGSVLVTLCDVASTFELPPARQELVVSRMAGDGDWGAGRAGMLYRDLIPGRLGGRFVASLIRIPVGGPVPDYVHFHKVRFQMIYCRTGWARLVYEDQGEPFLLESGDCVLQPPEIRHRVLEASAGLEVIEIGCPAEHETHVERQLALPTEREIPDRRFAGQRFVRHRAATASWRDWRKAGFEMRDTGIAAATDGLAGVCVARLKTGIEGHGTQSSRAAFEACQGEFLFWFVLKGGLTLDVEGHGRHQLNSGDSVVIPAGPAYAFEPGPDLEFLEVMLPATSPARRPRP